MMGVAAALMAVREKKASSAEKLFWLLTIFALLVAEVLAIRKDRNENQQAQAALRQMEMSNFLVIADSIKGSIDSNNEHFQETIRKVEHEIKLSKENLDGITGGDTYPTVIPLPIPVDGVNELPLALILHGTHPLYDVHVTVRDYPLPKVADVGKILREGTDTSISPTWSASSISPGVAILLPKRINPSVTGITSYLVSSDARNGKFVEKLHIKNTGRPLQKKGRVLLPWLYSYEISRNNRVIRKSSWVPTEMVGHLEPLGDLKR
jgi:hypothetical protein